MNFSQFGQVLTVGIAFLLVAAVAVAYFRANYAKATIETLKESNAALTERVQLLEQEDANKTTRLVAVERENGILRTLVSAHVEIQDLTSELRGYRSDMMIQFHELKKAVLNA